MQKTELTNLALDCELCNSQFTDARLTTLYERADQVDDTLYRDETTGVQKGERGQDGRPRPRAARVLRAARA